MESLQPHFIDFKEEIPDILAAQFTIQPFSYASISSLFRDIHIVLTESLTRQNDNSSFAWSAVPLIQTICQSIQMKLIIDPILPPGFTDPYQSILILDVYEHRSTPAYTTLPSIPVIPGSY